jgi:hypothetical protein
MELLSELSLYSPIRIGIEAFTENRGVWDKCVNLLIYIEIAQDIDNILSIIKSRGMDWRIVRRLERSFLCIY